MAVVVKELASCEYRYKFQAMLLLKNVRCWTTGGRYDLEVYHTFLMLHGKKLDDTIAYTSIHELLLMPYGARQQMLIINLSEPMKTRRVLYRDICFIASEDDTVVMKLPFTEQELLDFYEGLSKVMNGPKMEVMAKLLATFAKKPLIKPVSFYRENEEFSIGCSLKTRDGYLYPFADRFLFLDKTPVYLPFEEIAYVDFTRGEGETRVFQLHIEMKTPPIQIFGRIEKESFDMLFEFITYKKLEMKHSLFVDKMSYDEYFSRSEEPDFDKSSQSNTKFEQMEIETAGTSSSYVENAIVEEIPIEDDHIFLDMELGDNIPSCSKNEGDVSKQKVVHMETEKDNVAECLEEPKKLTVREKRPTYAAYFDSSDSEDELQCLEDITPDTIDSDSLLSNLYEEETEDGLNIMEINEPPLAVVAAPVGLPPDVESPPIGLPTDVESPADGLPPDVESQPVGLPPDVESPLVSFPPDVESSPVSFPPDVESPLVSFPPDVESSPVSFPPDVESPLVSFPPDVESSPVSFPPDVESPLVSFLPDVESPPVGFPPDVESQLVGLPPDVESPADGLPPDVESQPVGLPPDVESQPVGLPPDVESQPVGLPPDVESQPVGLPPDVESQPVGLPPDVESLPVGLPPDGESQPVGLPPDGESQPVGLPPDVESAADGLPPDVESQLVGLPPDVESQLVGLPPDVESPGDGLPPDVEPQLVGLPPDVESRPVGLPPDVESRPAGLPPDVESRSAGLPPDVESQPVGLSPDVEAALGKLALPAQTSPVNMPLAVEETPITRDGNHDGEGMGGNHTGEEEPVDL